MPRRAGRDFTAKDNETAPKVVVVSEALVRRYFGDGNPLGRTIGPGVKNNLGQFEIIGVAKDAKYDDLHFSKHSRCNHCQAEQRYIRRDHHIGGKPGSNSLWHQRAKHCTAAGSAQH